MIREKIYVWTCDFSNMSGEGNLARLFVKKLNIHYKTQIFQSNQILKNYGLLNYKYISPLIGIFFCWYQFILGRNFSYINYLPFWNFLLFLLLPPNTIFGPITGGSKFSNIKINFIRKNIFPVFYKISEIILNLRGVKAVFATELLKDDLGKNLYKKSNFNFIFNASKKKKREKKIIDFIIYYRKHGNKEDHFPFKFVKNLIREKYSIHVVGNKLKLSGIKNHGYINQTKLNFLLSKAKFTIGSGESLYTFFIMDCINNYVKIIVDKNYKFQIKYFVNNFYTLNFSKTLSFKKKELFIRKNN